MAGASEFYIQPSFFGFLGAIVAGRPYKGIPTPGAGVIAAVHGLPDCRNLAYASPPTLLEAYEIYSYQIAFGAYVRNSVAFAASPTLTLELALLVNDYPRYVSTESMETIPAFAGLQGRVNGAWVSDLVNPITIGARDRLGLRVGVISDAPADAEMGITIGAQYDPVTANPIGDVSTVSYRVIDVPASRRV